MFKRLFYNHDWFLTISILLILCIGLLTIYSTATYNNNDGSFQKQLIFAFTGIFFYFLFSAIDYSYFQYRPIVVFIYTIDLILLLLAFLAGHSAGGAVRWISLGALNFQPSEITKLVLIVSIGSFLTFKNSDTYKTLLQSLGIFIPLAVLVFIEPSLSSTIILLIAYVSIYFFSLKNQFLSFVYMLAALITINIGGSFIMPQVLFLSVLKGFSLGIFILSVIFVLIIYFSSKVNTKILSIILIVGLMLGIGTRYVVWDHLLKPYQKARISAYLSQDSSGNNSLASTQIFQLNQSKIAIGSGEIFGKGFAQGTQSKLDFLPDHNTDFIFASFSEEFGFIGDILLVFLFCSLYFRMISILEKINDRFGFLLMVGIISIFLFQTFANIGINVGLLPSTGIPMPLVSYGGSFLWISMSLLGITQNIYRQTNSKKWLSIEI